MSPKDIGPTTPISPAMMKVGREAAAPKIAQWEAQGITVHRDLLAIQTDIAKQLRNNRGYEGERLKRLHKLVVDVEARKAAMEEAQKVLLLAQARDPATQMLAVGNERLDGLKKEATAAFTETVTRTWKEDDGAGFQFRTKAVTRIADQPALAKSLVERNLWEAAGAQLSVDPKLISALLERKVPLPGVGIDVDVSVALYQPKEI